VQLALQCSDVAENPAISFGDDITVTINAASGSHAAVAAARSSSVLAQRTFQLTIVVGANATPGQRAATVTNPGQPTTTAAPAFLTVVPTGGRRV
jgi:hypothetical protein